MATTIFRVEKTKSYTVMSNYHLRDQELSLKAKGLLSLILSLPEDWDYTEKGLARICKEGVDALASAIKELERHGYVSRRRIRLANGTMGGMEYVIRERPADVSAPTPPQGENGEENGVEKDTPTSGSPSPDEPIRENPVLDNTAQLNTEEQNTDLENKELLNIYNISPVLSPNPSPIPSEMEGGAAAPERTGKEQTTASDSKKPVEIYRDLLRANIGYDELQADPDIDDRQLEEVFEIILETLCATRKTIRIARADYPAELVQAKLLRLRGEHIRFVLSRMRENTTEIRNIKQYLLAALFNAPSTIANYRVSDAAQKARAREKKSSFDLDEALKKATIHADTHSSAG